MRHLTVARVPAAPLLEAFPRADYTSVMFKRPALLVLFGLGAVASLGGAVFALRYGEAQASAPALPMAAQLRYMGRDTLTGMPIRVDDRFIAQAERAIERYGKDEAEAVPPPPLEGVDVTALSIDALGIRSATVDRFGLDAFGRLEVPQDDSTVGWNPAYSALPGEGGATFLAAHFEYANRPGPFFKLATLVPGDLIVVGTSDGQAHTYRVTSNIDYLLESIDMGALLKGREGIESITLMTCSGPPTADGYPQRTVVLAERMD